MLAGLKDVDDNIIQGEEKKYWKKQVKVITEEWGIRIPIKEFFY